MRMNLFKYGYLIRYAFDMGRIFPIIIKQRGLSKLIAGIGSHIIEAPNTFWLFLLNLDLQLKSNLFAILPRWISEMWLYFLNAFRLDTAIQSVLGQW
jgi:hypothetical protein